jgi:predicted membrane protein
MELPLVYLREVFDSALLIALVIVGIITIAIFNFTGATITKFFDALTRALLNVTKTVILWAVGLAVTFLVTNSDYEL